MPTGEETDRLQTVIDRKLAAKIRHIAKRSGKSESRIIAVLLQGALANPRESLKGYLTGEQQWLAEALGVRRG